MSDAVPESTVPETPIPSARRAELLELAYQYAVSRGRADLSLRPLAKAIGSSPRVLLYLFGSKDGLVRALLGRARADELALLQTARGETARGQDGAGGIRDGAGSIRDGAGSIRDGAGGTGDGAGGIGAAAGRIWAWLADEAHRGLLTLWVDGYARSLAEPDGPWGGFAAATVRDWLDVLAAAQPAAHRATAAGRAERTLVLAVLRGALLDLLATGDAERTAAAIDRQLAGLAGG